VNLLEATEEARRLSGLIDSGLSALRQQARALAAAEQEYRKAVAKAWLGAPEGTAGAREAWVQGECADLRHARDLADGMRQAPLEAVRSRRTQVSALQSLLAAHREEAGLARFGPES
jgi:hypothetical protein